jgi:hypothetical protein
VAKRSGSNRQASCNLLDRTIIKPRHPNALSCAYVYIAQARAVHSGGAPIRQLWLRRSSPRQ